MNITSSTRDQTVQRLLKEGFREQYTSENIIVLVRARHHSCLDIAEVDSDGRVNTGTLEEFLCKLLN